MRRREVLMAAALVLVPGRLPAATARRLSLRNAHTGETFDGPYRDGQGPIPAALADLALLLRDHHSNTVGPLDIGALDFLADVLDGVGEKRATILSAYRTAATNAALAATQFGVAEHSQHLVGRALDVTFERRLVEAAGVARSLKRGGVGWYPHSHFLHLDAGPVRSWQIEGSGLDTLFGGNGPGGALGRPPSLADRQRLARAIARRDFLARQKGGGA